MCLITQAKPTQQETIKSRGSHRMGENTLGRWWCGNLASWPVSEFALLVEDPPRSQKQGNMHMDSKKPGRDLPTELNPVGFNTEVVRTIK